MKGYYRKRGDKWSFTIDIGLDHATGKRKQKTKSGFKTKKEAQAMCAELITDYEKGSYVEPSKVSLKLFLTDYITNIESKRAIGTIKNYKKLAELYIIPNLGNLSLKDIQPITIQNYYNKMLKTLSPGTVKLHHDLLKQAFDKAIEWKWVKNNPAVMVGSPFRESPERKIWTVDQCFHFINHPTNYNRISSRRNYLICLLAMLTGFRRGEVLGIPESNVNFKTNEIAITQQLICDENERPYISETLKTKTSKRVVDAPQFVMDELRSYILEYKKFMLKNGRTNETGLIFATSKGKFIHPNNMNGMFSKTIKDMGLPHIHFHDLRHCHVEILNAAEINIKAISQRLGHKDTNTTLDTYTHLTPRMKEEVSERLNNMIKKNLA